MFAIKARVCNLHNLMIVLLSRVDRAVVKSDLFFFPAECW